MPQPRAMQNNPRVVLLSLAEKNTTKCKVSLHLNVTHESENYGFEIEVQLLQPFRLLKLFWLMMPDIKILTFDF